jgi:hypothetical protein
MAPRPSVQLPHVPDDWLADGTQTPSQQNGLNGQAGQVNGSSQSSPKLPSTTLEYDGATHQLTVSKSDGTIQTYPANNNLDSASKGHWPNGTFSYGYHTTHSDDAPDSRFGSYGNYIFNVPGREYMGVHSGRANTVDGRGGVGVNHVTDGCIRTTDDGVAAIRDANSSGHPITSITVRNN